MLDQSISEFDWRIHQFASSNPETGLGLNVKINLDIISEVIAHPGILPNTANWTTIRQRMEAAGITLDLTESDIHKSWQC